MTYLWDKIKDNLMYIYVGVGVPLLLFSANFYGPLWFVFYPIACLIGMAIVGHGPNAQKSTQQYRGDQDGN